MNELRIKLTVCILLFGTIFLLYSSSINNPFLWDDWIFYFHNAATFSNPNNMLNLLNPDYFKLSLERSYRPMATLSYFCNFIFWDGFTPGHRALNPILHWISSCLIFLVIYKLYKNMNLAILTSFLFVAHPVHTEVILCITHNENVLLAVFLLLSFYIYMSNLDPKFEFFKQILSSIMFLLALFSKETALVYLPLMFLYERIFRPEENIVNSIKRVTAYYFLVTMFYLVVRFGYMTSPYQHEFLGNSFVTNLMTMIHVISKYILLLIFPTNLSILHKIDIIKSPLDIHFVSAIIILSIFLMLCYFLYRQNTKSFFMLCWSILTLLPALNILFVVLAHPFGERYLYLTTIGYCFILSHVITKYIKPLPLLLLISGIIFIFYSQLTLARSDDWKSVDAFNTKLVKQAPWSEKGYHNLGVYYATVPGKNRIAEEYLKKATELNPYEWLGFLSLAKFYETTNQYEKEIEVLRKGIEYNHEPPELYIALSLAYSRIGLHDEGIRILESGLQIDHRNTQARFSIAKIYEAKGMYDDAIKHYNLGIRFDPNSSSFCWQGLANIYYKLGQLEKAKIAINHAIQLQPFDLNFRLTRGDILLKNNALLAARNEFRFVLKINPYSKHAVDSLVMINKKLNKK